MTTLSLDVDSIEFTVCTPTLAIVTVGIDDGDGLEWLVRIEIRRERAQAMASVNLPADTVYPAELETALARFALAAYNSELALRKQAAAVVPFPRGPKVGWAESLAKPDSVGTLQ